MPSKFGNAKLHSRYNLSDLISRWSDSAVWMNKQYMCVGICVYRREAALSTCRTQFPKNIDVIRYIKVKNSTAWIEL